MVEPQESWGDTDPPRNALTNIDDVSLSVRKLRTTTDWALQNSLMLRNGEVIADLAKVERIVPMDSRLIFHTKNRRVLADVEADCGALGLTFANERHRVDLFLRNVLHRFSEICPDAVVGNGHEEVSAQSYAETMVRTGPPRRLPMWQRVVVLALFLILGAAIFVGTTLLPSTIVQ